MKYSKMAVSSGSLPCTSEAESGASRKRDNSSACLACKLRHNTLASFSRSWIFAQVSGMAAGAEAKPPHPVPAADSAPVDVSGVARAEGGKTVAEVFAEKDALVGKPVTLRGKVVKSNTGIMGKNWIHVRDGSGSDGSNDLTVPPLRRNPTWATPSSSPGPSA